MIREQSGIAAKLEPTLGGPERASEQKDINKIIGDDVVDRVSTIIKKSPQLAAMSADELFGELQKVAKMAGPLQGATDDQLRALMKRLKIGDK